MKITWFDLAEWFPKMGPGKNSIHTHNFVVAFDYVIYMKKYNNNKKYA